VQVLKKVQRSPEKFVTNAGDGVFAIARIKSSLDPAVPGGPTSLQTVSGYRLDRRIP
jgi:hypothetical protein